jgi:7-carboxy-7-deazaguanine synthase
MTGNIIDLHTCIQGEGLFAGIPHILIRTSGCNLRCAFSNSICDTPYSSYKPEQAKYTFEDVIKMVRSQPQINHLLLTGGEPLLWQELLLSICRHFDEHFLTIETNGTLAPTPDNEELFSLIDLWSISPKLSSQLLTPEKSLKFNIPWVQRKVYDNTYLARKIIRLKKSYQLKYVVGAEEDFSEVEEHISKIYKGMETESRQIYLMPAGDNEESLQQTRRMVAEYCISKGYNYTDRLQYVIYGTKRDA